jgi:hypothetical protein
MSTRLSTIVLPQSALGKVGDATANARKDRAMAWPWRFNLTQRIELVRADGTSGCSETSSEVLRKGQPSWRAVGRPTAAAAAPAPPRGVGAVVAPAHEPRQHRER